jgi:hypothetical protein
MNLSSLWLYAESALTPPVTIALMFGLIATVFIFSCIVLPSSRGICYHCGVVFSWDNARRVADRSDPDQGEERWKRSADGKTAVAKERWPALDSVTCVNCAHINTRSCWSDTEWTQVGDPFPVTDCPMCDGEGETPIHKRRSGRVKYVARCGFCGGDGYVSGEKMSRFRWEPK